MNYNDVINSLNNEFVFDPEAFRSEPDKADWWGFSRHLIGMPIDFIREFREYIQWERVDFEKLKRAYKKH